MEEKKVNPSEVLCSDLFKVFTNRYAPCNSIQEADIFLSTYEIHTEIVSHVNDNGISELMVYNMLTEHGFMYEILEGARFMWLLKSKNL